MFCVVVLYMLKKHSSFNVSYVDIEKNARGLGSMATNTDLDTDADMDT